MCEMSGVLRNWQGNKKDWQIVYKKKKDDIMILSLMTIMSVRQIEFL